MLRSEMNKILMHLYKLDVDTDEAVKNREKASALGDKEREAICQHRIDCLSFQYRGMENVLKSLGYKFVDDDGFWKIERRT